VLAIGVDECQVRAAGGDGAALPLGDGPAVTEAGVTVDRRGDAVHIALAGEVDMANADAVERQIQWGISGATAGVTLDLTGLDWIDSAGLWVLLRLGSHLSGAKIAGEVLIPRDGPVRRMVETAGIAAAIPVRLGRDE
jgi:anti-anti-sigma factor